MEIVVMIIMLLSGLAFLLKLTWHGIVGRTILTCVASAFLCFTWEYAIRQSRTQISDWLSQPELMLDTSVILTVDVAFQILFCVLMGKRVAGGHLGRAEAALLSVCLWFPGLLVFPVLFSALVELVFSMPGIGFALIGYGMALAVAAGVPVAVYVVKVAIPEQDFRLELMFLVNLLVAVLGVVATVNGRTASVGTDGIEWCSLAGVLAIFAVGSVAGFFFNRHLVNKQNSKIK